MSHSGTITIGTNVQVVRSLQYHSRKDRHKIIDNWQRLYASRFNQCFLVILPDTDDNVNMNGTNGRSGDKLTV
jgi:hypothetical protein